MLIVTHASPAIMALAADHLLPVLAVRHILGELDIHGGFQQIPRPATPSSRHTELSTAMASARRTRASAYGSPSAAPLILIAILRPFRLGGSDRHFHKSQFVYTAYQFRQLQQTNECEGLCHNRYIQHDPDRRHSWHPTNCDYFKTRPQHPLQGFQPHMDRARCV